jgi:hypothetical protein
MPDPAEQGVVAQCCLAASSARLASIASLWDDKDGAAEFDVSSSLPDAVSTRFGRGGADGMVFVAIGRNREIQQYPVIGRYLLFLLV